MRLRLIIKDVKCPTCDSPEVDPKDSTKLLIRGFKVCDDYDYWWSQCLVCSKGDPNKGWF